MYSKNISVQVTTAVVLIVYFSHPVYPEVRVFSGAFLHLPPSPLPTCPAVPINAKTKMNNNQITREFRGSGHGVFKRSRVGSGRVRKLPKSRGSGRAKRLSKLAGRVRSGQEFFQISRVGSGRVEFFFNLTGQVGSRGDEKLTGRVRS